MGGQLYDCIDTIKMLLLIDIDHGKHHGAHGPLTVFKNITYRKERNVPRAFLDASICQNIDRCLIFYLFCGIFEYFDLVFFTSQNVRKWFFYK